MKNLKIVLVIVFGLMTESGYSNSGFEIRLGSSIPVFNFASANASSSEAGGAALGFNAGLHFTYPLKGLGFYGGIDLNYNGLQSSVKADVEKLYRTMGIINADISYYKYRNIPLSAGVNYAFLDDDGKGVFVNAGLALNFLKLTDMELKTQNVTYTITTNPATNLGYKIGGGILFSSGATLSLDYFALGVHDIEGRIVASRSGSTRFNTEGKVDLLTLTMGFRF
jgi:hypothetical protein